MDVTLIDYTGAGHSDPLYAARLLAYAKNTRLQQGAVGLSSFMNMSEEDLKAELDYIANTLRSSWEFVDYTFQITDVTRAFTHQLVRSRHGSYAQQAQRVVDMSDFYAVTPPTVEGDKERERAWFTGLEAVKATYGWLQSLGVPNQDCRGILPTNVCTNIIAKFNLRSLADLLGKRRNLRAQGEYQEVARRMEERVYDVHPWARPFLNPDRLATPTLDGILKDILGDRSPVDDPRVNAALKELDKLKATWG